MAKEIDGLPDVDLSPIVKDIEDSSRQVQADAQQQTAPVPDQFKTDADRQKAYKELQAAYTRETQEKKRISEQLKAREEEMELLRLAQYQPTYTTPQQQYVPQQQGQVYEEPLEMKVDRAVTVREIAGVLEREASKNRDEFQERYAYAQAVSRQYPQLTRSGVGVEKLFELGDKLREQNLKRSAGKALESIFGEPLGEEAINKLRTLVKGDKAITQSNLSQNAYMPETSTSTRSGSDQNQTQTFDMEIENAKKKGDVDGVISALLKKQLAE